jgi:hypothetical protein
MTIVRGLTFNDIDTTWAMFFFFVEYMVGECFTPVPLSL